MPAEIKDFRNACEDTITLTKRWAAPMLSFFITIISITCCLFSSSPALAEPSLLAKLTAEYNLDQINKSLASKSYRGEEGILRINPVMAEPLGLKVIQDQDYQKADEFYKEASELFKRAVSEMKNADADDPAKIHAKNVAVLSARYNTTVVLAWNHMMSYRSKVTTGADERLNNEICFNLLERLLREELDKASYNLREALGGLWNRCQGMDGSHPLNTGNVEFVNNVFSAFVKTAPPDVTGKFNLDSEKDQEGLNSMWKLIIEESAPRFVPVFERVFQRQSRGPYPINEILFLALVRQESNFNPRSVSYVGAAGLTQIIPATGLELGMNSIFNPDYLKEAQEQMRLERTLRKKAIDQIFLIKDQDCIEPAQQAVGYMKQSLACGERRDKLLKRYRMELLQTSYDERLDPDRSLDYGLRYFSKMMNINNGDMSLALASYNAGPHRVSQYNGIPPFNETIEFRNKVLGYYEEYRSRVREYIAENRE
ncbi:hypothetical protein PITCH_A1150017 [uncultured Desulfobacterium sp.]|uniref:Transglycosylase SLT domain-containing protein n=1 Tax=uncultured Desulfobacterium sp. TaxID=201089 RepID=A0A445MRE4_9BACT|nr:hypothetical protein PITCH_A1150017 [uncultured Desulfobacterium sp.]